MTPPDPRASKAVGAAVLNAVDAEIIAEQAAALARAARRFEKAMAMLSDFDAGSPPRPRRGQPPADRPTLLAEARDALWCLVVQREACGFRNSDALLSAYRVPKEVSLNVARPAMIRWRRSG